MLLFLNKEASLQEKIDASEKLKAGCCNVKETLDIMIVNIEERIRELQDLFPESDDQKQHCRLLLLLGFHNFLDIAMKYSGQKRPARFIWWNGFLHVISLPKTCVTVVTLKFCWRGWFRDKDESRICREDYQKKRETLKGN